MEFTKGILSGYGLKFVVYGPEGIGKSTFVSRIPGVAVIDTEGSTGMLDVVRYPDPTSWQMLLDEVDDFAGRPEFSALVIDTADWAERLCIRQVLATKQWDSIEDPGYGRGYVYVAEEFGKLLDRLTICAEHGKHVGFTAHAMMRKFEQPDELGAYDRWELKMSKKAAPMVKEWSDLLLFANYKTIVYKTDDKGKKNKAAGGQRVMYTTHHPCWDAKNRHALPEELPFDFGQVAQLFAPVSWNPVAGNSLPGGQPAVPPTFPDVSQPDVLPPLAEVPAVVSGQPSSAGEVKPSVGSSQLTAEASQPPAAAVQISESSGLPPAASSESEYADIPKTLLDLMEPDEITPLEIRTAIAQKGYFPLETPFRNLPPEFV